MLKPMTEKDYSDFWESESSQFQRENIYAALSKISPAEATLEVGCGAGWSTLSLAANRPVLAIDNNPHLIDLARSRLNNNGVSVEIIKSDLFEPTVELLAAINRFQPKVVTGWFIGSHPADNDRRTPAHLRIDEKPKAYRENVEDQLVVAPLCPDSVEWVHTVQRGAVPPGVTEAQIREGMIEEYESYMFKDSGFKVTDVQVLDWNKGASAFPYIQNPNPNLPKGEAKPVVISILAHRVPVVKKNY